MNGKFYINKINLFCLQLKYYKNLRTFVLRDKLIKLFAERCLSELKSLNGLRLDLIVVRLWSRQSPNINEISVSPHQPT